jgi:hypothetical protein
MSKVSSSTDTYPWPPPQEEKWYYSIPSPESQQSSLTQAILNPLLDFLGFPSSTNKDPTFGRFDLPYSPREEKIKTGKGNKVEGFKVPFGKPGEWVWYQVSSDVEFLACFETSFKFQIYENSQAVSEAGKYALNPIFKKVLKRSHLGHYGT